MPRISKETVSSSSGGLLGTWNASTNTPTLSNTDTGKIGVMYKVSDAGSNDFGAGSISFEVGDIVVNDGSVWSRIDATDAVISVNGNTGVVVLDADDIGDGSVSNTEFQYLNGVTSAIQTQINNAGGSTNKIGYINSNKTVSANYASLISVTGLKSSKKYNFIFVGIIDSNNLALNEIGFYISGQYSSDYNYTIQLYKDGVLESVVSKVDDTTEDPLGTGLSAYHFELPTGLTLNTNEGLIIARGTVENSSSTKTLYGMVNGGNPFYVKEGSYIIYIEG
ncbi:hypothetical protein KC717_06790 [Candidatus Dojkabacteria bacterium]|uniref:Uncharacterized protein n=1 Tax=Candidatus Dojkabacteria bacterium TaxID=2099670 RepID=A0A955LA24_9BACT|nr:hypothetical protein [Candidatus Dojkabacteria bacterium]